VGDTWITVFERTVVNQVGTVSFTLGSHGGAWCIAANMSSTLGDLACDVVFTEDTTASGSTFLTNDFDLNLAVGDRVVVVAGKPTDTSHTGHEWVRTGMSPIGMTEWCDALSTTGNDMSVIMAATNPVTAPGTGLSAFRMSAGNPANNYGVAAVVRFYEPSSGFTGWGVPL
jgi:hypothetical protein